MNSLRFARFARAFFRQRALLLAAVVSGFGPFLVAPARGASADTGVIVGQVSNQATGGLLEGARVEIKGSGRTEAAGTEGRFQIAAPRGAVILVVSYTGLDPQEVAVEVPAGGTVLQNIALTSGVYRLDAFTVSGLREGSARAITEQRLAPNVKNVVASDSFGNLADGNIGDFLQQMPGVTANYVGADVRSVMVRGINADLNSVTMDGTRLASAPSGGAVRGFEFEQASLGLIETIEVTKSPTPDMDADSIGGNVNLVSKSPFDRAVPKFFTYSIGGVWRPKYMTNSREFIREPIDDIGPSVNFAYSDVYGPRKNLGVLLNATYHSQPGGDTAALMNYEPKLADPVYVYNVNAPRPAGAPRTRLSLGAKLDYKLSEHTIVTFNTFSNWFHENNDTRIHALTTGNAAANFRPGYTSTFSEILPSAASFSQVSTFNDDKFGRTYAFQPSVRHRLPGLDIDYGGSFSNSFTQWEHATKDRHSPWHSPLGQNKGSTSAILRNVGWSVDRTESLQWPKLTQTAGPDFYDINNYTGLNISNADRGQEDVVIAGRVNARKRLAFARPTTIKVGASYREQERRAWNYTTNWDYTGPDGIFGTADDSVGIGQFLDRSGQWKDSNEGYRQPPWLSSYAANQHKVENPQLWAPRITSAATGSLLESTVTAMNNDRTATETVTAAYAMANTKFGRLSVLAGVRMEDTDTEAEGPLNAITADERARRAAWVGAVTREEANRRALAQYATRTSSSGGYRNVFPGAHLKYEVRDGLLLRADYASSIGRPNFENLMPRTVVNDAGTGSVSVSNTALKPQFSDNFDVSAEYYFEPAGVISAGVFLKEVKDFIFTTTSTIQAGTDNGFDGQYVGYTLSKAFNGGRARYRGFELSYRQQFTFLPGFWKGFGVNLNYSYTSSFGDYGGASSTSKVAGLVPRTGNINLSYIGRGFDVRLSANWRGRTLVGISANPALERYQKPKMQVNLKTKYSISQHVQVFCDIENLNKSPITETYWGVESRPAETRIVVAKVVAGVQGRF